MHKRTNIEQKNLLLRQYTIFSVLWFGIFSILLTLFIQSELKGYFTKISSSHPQIYADLDHILKHIIIFLGSGISVVFMILFIIIFKASRDLIKLQNAELVKNDLVRYFSPQVADSIISNHSDVDFGVPVRTEATILFMDIRGFTSRSEHDDPEEIFKLLNQFYNEMIEILFQNNGVLDKIIGDSLMGLFGVPIQNQDKCRLAVRTAISMQKTAKDFNDIIEKKFQKSFPIGIGINNGMCIAGNLGSEGRKIEYTVIGDTVNTAARLQGIAAPGEIIISEDVKNNISGEFELVALDDVMLKGKEKPTKVYKIVY